MIEHAMSALRRGDVKRTLEMANEVLKEQPENAEGHQLRGIALTRMGKIDEATKSLRAATKYDPNEPKHFYNLAVNLKDRGMLDESNQMAEQAVKLNPAHAGALGLLGRAPDEPTGAGPFTARVGYGEQEHMLAFLSGTEKLWTGIGYGFLAIATVLAVLMIVHFPLHLTGKPVPKNEMPDVGWRPDTLSVFICFLWVLSSVLTFMWMFIDMIDRRIKFTWLVPLLVFSVLGFNAVPLALYMFLARRFFSNNVSKA